MIIHYIIAIHGPLSIIKSKTKTFYLLIKLIYIYLDKLGKAGAILKVEYIKATFISI